MRRASGLCLGLVASLGVVACGSSSLGLSDARSPDGTAGTDAEGPGTAGAGTAGSGTAGAGSGSGGTGSGGGGAPDGSSDAGGTTGVAGRDGAAGSSTDGGNPDGAAGSSTDGGRSDEPPDAPSDGTSDGSVSDPTPGVGSHLVVAGPSIVLAGSGRDSCTNQIPYWTDRWCAFARPGALLGNEELWVIDVSKVAAGTEVRCSTTTPDPSCLRLSIGVLNDQTFGFRKHRFDGDTLIYAEAGNIFAWRPGWTTARKISSLTGELCVAGKTTATALCLQNVDIDTAMTRGTIELHAGRIDDASGGELPFVDSFIFETKDDAQGDFSRYGWQLSDDGKYVAWSGRYAVGGKEILKVQTIGNDASRATVAEDVSMWSVSRDGSKWLWLSAFNYDGTGKASGTLQSAPFPAGTAPRNLATNVGSFVPAGPKGLAVQTGLAPNSVGLGVGTLLLMPDIDAPATVKTLDTNVLRVFDVTSDGKQLMYAKNEELLGQTLAVFDLFVARDDGSTPCTLSRSVTAFADPSAPAFLSSGSVAVFGRFSQAGEGEGFWANVAACTAKKLASEIYAWNAIGDEGYVFSDELVIGANGGPETTLRYAVAANGALPASGTKIQTRAGLLFAPLTPALAGVVYTVTAGTTADGLYLNTSLPFKTVAPIQAPPP